MRKSETILQNEIRTAVRDRTGQVAPKVWDRKSLFCLRIKQDAQNMSCYRFVRCGVRGMSDLLFVGNGYIAWLECKTDKGELTFEQAEFLKNMRELGHRASVVRSVKEALKIIKSEGEAEKMIKIDYKGLTESLIPEGQYEVVIKSAFLDATRGGTEFINVQFVVRNDVEQKYKNKYIFYQVWKKKEPSEQDKICEGFSSKQLFKLCQAVNIPAEKEFANLDAMLEELIGKPLLIGVKHGFYNDKKQENVSFMSVTEFPDCVHEFRKINSNLENKTEEIIINSDYLPF